MSPDETIVITGVGVITSLGRGRRAILDACCAGHSGIGPMPALEQTPEPDKGGGQAVEIPGATHDETRAAHYLRAAIGDALQEAEVAGAIPTARRAAVLGSTLHGMRAAGAALRTGEFPRLRAFLAGAVLDQAVEGFDVGPIRLTTCAACSSGLSSIGLAMTLLRAGIADIVVAGGYDSVSEYAYAGFDSLRLVSAGPIHPFAADRVGMKTAEGYAALVLERASGARARGAPVRAVVAGYGESSDAFHLTQPHPEGVGAARAIRAVLDEAHLHPSEIGLIGAHSTGTPHNDSAEYHALHAALQPHLSSIPVVGFKAHVGHTLGGAGAVELALSLAAMEASLAPPTPGADQRDPAFTELTLVVDTPQPRTINATLNLSLGFGGANTAVALRRLDPEHAADRRPPAQVVITGIGVLLPGIVGCDPFAHALKHARPVAAGPLDPEDYAPLLTARRARRISEYAKLSLAAATQAWQSSELPENAALDAAAILGTTHGSTAYCEKYYSQVVAEGLGAANPVYFAEGVPNAAAAHLSMGLGLRSGCQTIIGTRCAGVEALALAALRIAEGRTDTCVVAAAEEYSELAVRAYRACDTPLQSGAASGAIAFILESRTAAEDRGARILASLDPLGAAWTFDHESIVRDFALETWLDAAPDHLLRHPDTLLRTVPGPSPEMYSVSGLATVVAALLEGASACGVVSRDFSGRCVSIGITRD